MEVKPGYKQTEVGVIPGDWESVDYVAFGQVIDGDRGVHYPGIGELRDSGDCLFLNAGNVTKRGFRFGECQFISAEKDRKLSKGKLTRGDVILTTRGTIGNFALFNDAVPYKDIRINSGMVILRNASPTVSNEYQYFVLQSQVVTTQIDRLSFGSAQPQLTVKGINTFKLPLPPTKAEQEAIAEALSDADALIESIEQLLVKKRQLKQGAMQELLTGKKRLPGFSGEWGVKLLGDVIRQIADGATPSTSNPLNFGGPIRWVVIEDIRDEITTTRSTLTERGLQSCAAKLWPAGTLILSTGATIGEVGIARVPVATKQGICGIVVNQVKADTTFLKYWFTANKATLLSKAQGSTIKEVRAPTLVQFEIRTPTIGEQTAIAVILSDMDAEIAALEAKLGKVRQVKQGMMQELLTGRIRLV